jgi:hypothetical protein
MDVDGLMLQIMKRNMDPRWEYTFELQLKEPSVDGHLHVEDMSKNMDLKMHFKVIYRYILKLIEFQCLGCLCIFEKTLKSTLYKGCVL